MGEVIAEKKANYLIPGEERGMKLKERKVTREAEEKEKRTVLWTSVRK